MWVSCVPVYYGCVIYVVCSMCCFCVLLFCLWIVICHCSGLVFVTLMCLLLFCVRVFVLCVCDCVLDVFALRVFVSCCYVNVSVIIVVVVLCCLSDWCC